MLQFLVKEVTAPNKFTEGCTCYFGPFDSQQEARDYIERTLKRGDWLPPGTRTYTIHHLFK